MHKDEIKNEIIEALDRLSDRAFQNLLSLLKEFEDKYPPLLIGDNLERLAK